jgi:hypothetical protein
MNTRHEHIEAGLCCMYGVLCTDNWHVLPFIPQINYLLPKVEHSRHITSPSSSIPTYLGTYTYLPYTGHMINLHCCHTYLGTYLGDDQRIPTIADCQRLGKVPRLVGMLPDI